MRKVFHSFFKAFWIILILLCLTGCWNRRELDTLAVLIGVGVDKADLPQKINFTGQVANPRRVASVEGQSESPLPAYWNIEYTSANLFSAMRESTFTSSRKLYIGQNQILAFGEDLARDGIGQYVDTFLRDHEARLDEYIVVARGKARDLLNVKPELEKIPAANLNKLLEIYFATSKVVLVRLIDFASALASETTAPIAPLAEIQGEGENRKVVMAGTAVFDDDRMIGELSPDETMGYMWAVNKVKSGVISTTAPQETLRLEILKAKSKMSIHKQADGSILIKISVLADVNVAGQDGPDDLLKPDVTAFVENQGAFAVKSCIQSSINKAKELKADIFGFGEAIRRKYPKEWETMKGEWATLFPGIKTELDVKIKLRGSGEIIQIVQPHHEKG